MKRLIPLLMVLGAPFAQASKGRVFDDAPLGVVHIQTESAGHIADHYIPVDQIVLVNSVSPCDLKSGEISWVNIQTNIPSSKFIGGEGESKFVLFTLDFATRDEAVAAVRQIMKRLSQASLTSEPSPRRQAQRHQKEAEPVAAPNGP